MRLLDLFRHEVLNLSADLWIQTGHWPLSHRLTSSMAPFSDEFSLGLHDRSRCQLKTSGPDGSGRSRGKIVKYDNRAISSRLEQSYQTKQLKQLLLTYSITDKILTCDGKRSTLGKKIGS